MRHRQNLVLFSRMVTAWWIGIAAKIDGAAVLEMVEEEVEEEEYGEVDIFRENFVAMLPC